MNLKGFKKWLQRLRQPEARETPPSIPVPEKRPAVPEAAKTTPAQATPQDTAPRSRSPGRSPRPRPLSRKSAAQRPVSRQGIPILMPDEDLAGYFMAAEENPARHEHAGAKTGDGSPLTDGARDRSRRRAAPERNRVGMRRLEGDHDLWGHFLSATPEAAAEPDEPGPSAASSDRRNASGGVPDTASGTDRHGIPRLDNHAALERYFETAVDDPSQAEALGEVFRQSLDHDARSLLKKKTGGVFAPRRLTLKERLRRYPAPQAQLDLHGATALEARQRTEVFIQSARTEGLFTVRVIVGKGLHSEGGAVLPDVIEELLLALKRTGTVLTYRWEKDIKRKSGAVIVYLSPA